jgi:hypothetical protein
MASQSVSVLPIEFYGWNDMVFGFLQGAYAVTAKHG